MDYSLLTEQKISEKFERLPQDLKNILSLVNTSIAIENIAAKYRLNEEKTTMLIQLVGLVILGFAGLEDMKEEMKETIDINPQFIPLIADEIRQKIFLPVINSLQKIATEKHPPIPTAPAISTIPATPVSPELTPAPSIDRYREPTAGPEVIDLRKAPTPTPTPKPIMPAPPLTFTRPIEPPKPEIPVVPPAAPMPPKPVEPVKPVELIEAEPHKIPILTEKPIVSVPKPIDTYREPPETKNPPLVSTPIPTSTPPTSEPRPQYIIRPSGLPPTDLPENVLDLRKDKGEF